MADTFRIHETARIRSGKYAGMVGEVTETRSDDAGRQVSVKVKISGVRDNESLSAERWFRSHEVERNHG